MSKVGRVDDADLISRMNPLAWALGQFIQRARKSGQQYSKGEQLAEMLGVQPGTYRLVEAGGAALQPEYGHRLIAALGAAIQISWARLSSLLVATQHIPRKSVQVDPLIEALQLFQRYEPASEDLVSKLSEAMQKGRSRKDKRLQESIANSVQAFLCERTALDHAVAPGASSPWDLFMHCDPLLLDQHLRTLTELSVLNATIQAKDLNSWEKLNVSRFSRVIGLVSRGTIREDTLRTFDWPFLKRSSYRPCTILLWHGSVQGDALALRELLSQVVADSPLQDLTIQSLGKKAEKAVKTELRRKGLPTTDGLNYWAYDIRYVSVDNFRLPIVVRDSVSTSDLRRSNASQGPTAEVLSVGESQTFYQIIADVVQEGNYD